jgi:hypothetical protein
LFVLFVHIFVASSFFFIAGGISFFFYSVCVMCRSPSLHFFCSLFFVDFCVHRFALITCYLCISFCLDVTHQGTMRQDREVCCDSGLSRLAIVARPSGGSELCAVSGGPCSERRLGAAALTFPRVGPALNTGASFRLEPALRVANVLRGLFGLLRFLFKGGADRGEDFV